MTDIGKRLLDNLPPKFNKDGEIITALVANENGTGAIEKMFLYGDKVKNNYSQADNVYTMDSDLIDQAMKFFSYFERFYRETDESFTKRNKSIFIRSGDVTWGTSWNVKHVFEYYFGNAEIFLLENIGPWYENMLVNSNFEATEPEEINKWVVSGCEISNLGAFAGEKGVYFKQDNGSISQTVHVEKDNAYFVTFAISGKGAVEVNGSNGDTKKLFTVGEKIETGSGIKREVTTEDWDFIQFFFVADKTEDVSINVYGDKGTTADLITLDKKKNFPCFVIYSWFGGVTIGENTLHLAKSGEDPIPGIDYSKEGYFDHVYFSGVSGKSFAAEIYQDILTMVKAAGTKADLVLLTRET